MPRVIENSDKVIENKEKVIENGDRVIENEEKLIEKDKLLVQIASLEKKMLNEKQPRRKREYFEQIKKLRLLV